MLSIKKNFFYSSILTTANYIFPFILFPYISRVLGVENNGKCNFVDSIVNYFILFSTMGTAILGIREIAAHRGDMRQLSSAFSSLLGLNFVATIVVALLFLCAILFVPYLHSYRELLYMGLLKLVFNVFLVEWFFKGLEEFRYITLRTILVRGIFIVSVFVLVRSVDDYRLYFFLTVMAVVVNASVNGLYARRFVTFSIRDVSLKRYVGPFFMLGVYLLLTSMYTSFNVTFLGFVAGDVQVGYYSTAVKLFNIILAVFSAFTGVMLPRMSALVENCKFEEFKVLLYKSTGILFSMSVPLAVFTIVMAHPIVLFIAGPGYEGAILPLQIVAPLILVIGYEQILVMQALMPLKEDKAILRNSFYGALCGVALNAWLVPEWGCLGSSICWLLAEMLILVLSQIVLSGKIGLQFPFRRLLIVVAGYMPLFPLLWLPLHYFAGQIVWQLFVGGVVMLCYVVFIQVVFIKDPVLLSFVRKYVG